MIKKGYVETPEGLVHYRTAGTGEPLLLLHQTAFSSDEYTEMISFLEKKFRVIAMDTLGYGCSDKPPAGFTVEDYGRNIMHFLDGLGIKKTNVAGHHTGATLAGEIAASYPDRIKKVVMSGVSLYTPEERQQYSNNPMFSPMRITEDGKFFLELWSFFRDASKQLPIESTYRMVLAMLEAGPRLHDAHHAAFRYEKEPKLPKIKSPVLVMCGENDMFLSKLPQVQKLIPGSKVQVIKGAGNLLAWEKPQEFAQAIIDFIINQVS